MVDVVDRHLDLVVRRDLPGGHEKLPVEVELEFVLRELHALEASDRVERTTSPVYGLPDVLVRLVVDDNDGTILLPGEEVDGARDVEIGVEHNALHLDVVQLAELSGSVLELRGDGNGSGEHGPLQLVRRVFRGHVGQDGFVDGMDPGPEVSGALGVLLPFGEDLLVGETRILRVTGTLAHGSKGGVPVELPDEHIDERRTTDVVDAAVGSDGPVCVGRGGELDRAPVLVRPLLGDGEPGEVGLRFGGPLCELGERILGPHAAERRHGLHRLLAERGFLGHPVGFQQAFDGRRFGGLPRLHDGTGQDHVEEDPPRGVDVCLAISRLDRDVLVRIREPVWHHDPDERIDDILQSLEDPGEYGLAGLGVDGDLLGAVGPVAHACRVLPERICEGLLVVPRTGVVGRSRYRLEVLSEVFAVLLGDCPHCEQHRHRRVEVLVEQRLLVNRGGVEPYAGAQSPHPLGIDHEHGRVTGVTSTATGDGGGTVLLGECEPDSVRYGAEPLDRQFPELGFCLRHARQHGAEHRRTVEVNGDWVSIGIVLGRRGPVAELDADDGADIVADPLAEHVSDDVTFDDDGVALNADGCVGALRLELLQGLLQTSGEVLGGRPTGFGLVVRDGDVGRSRKLLRDGCPGQRVGRIRHPTGLVDRLGDVGDPCDRRQRGTEAGAEPNNVDVPEEVVPLGIHLKCHHRVGLCIVDSVMGVLDDTLKAVMLYTGLQPVPISFDPREPVLLLFVGMRRETEPVRRDGGGIEPVAFGEGASHAEPGEFRRHHAGVELHIVSDEQCSAGYHGEQLGEDFRDIGTVTGEELVGDTGLLCGFLGHELSVGQLDVCAEFTSILRLYGFKTAVRTLDVLDRTDLNDVVLVGF